MPFDGLRVIAFESRRAPEMAELIRRQGGEAFVAPSMREAPLENNTEAFRFGERLFQGEFDTVVLLTGVGTKALDAVLATRYPPQRFAEALRTVTVIARGPKPAAVLRQMQVPIAAVAPEPNTWRELLAVTEGLPAKRIAVQEYGKTNHELIEALRARGAEVTTVPVYQWALPDDLEPLREAARRIEQGQAAVALFTTSIQLDHLFEVGGPGVREGLCKMVIASIGPTTSEALEEHGLKADLEPSHPKMGFLVKETADQAAAILARKQAATPKDNA